MTDAIIVALIAGIASVLGISIKAAVDGHVARRDQAAAQTAASAELAAIRHQVQNSHGTNLRNDLDVVIAGIQQIKTMQAEHGSQIADLRRDMGGVRVELRDVRRDMSSIHEADREADRIHRSLGDRISALAERFGRDAA